MSEGSPTVKRARTYDSNGRHERARLQHAATLDTAASLFRTHGYALTTVESIAQAAGISAATIYKSYGGKAGLVRSLCHCALAGVGPVPAEVRSNALRAGCDVLQVIEGWGHLLAEVSPRVAPLLLLLRDAAGGDPEANALHDELERDRLARMADNADYLGRGGHLRSGVTTSDARDILWTCSSPELYDLLIDRRSWTIAKYRRFVTDMMTNMLVPLSS